MNRIRLFMLAVVMAAGLVGCAATMSAFLSGGQVVESSYTPDKILVTYKVASEVTKFTSPVDEGRIFPLTGGISKMIYQLIETPKGLSFYEKDPGGKGVLCSTHWDDSENDYFECYTINRDDAFRYVAPKDRSKDVKRYHYGRGETPAKGNSAWRPIPFTIDSVEGVSRIVPNDTAGFSVVLLTPVTNQ